MQDFKFENLLKEKLLSSRPFSSGYVSVSETLRVLILNCFILFVLFFFPEICTVLSSHRGQMHLVGRKI
jgi:hypothetical protein